MSTNATFPPYAVNRPTSREAAAEILPNLNRLQGIVLRALRAAGDDGLTDQQIHQATGLPETTARVRRIELLAMGMVVSTDKRRETSSGRSALVWRAADVDSANWKQTNLFNAAVSATETGY